MRTWLSSFLIPFYFVWWNPLKITCPSHVFPGIHLPEGIPTNGHLLEKRRQGLGPRGWVGVGPGASKFNLCTNFFIWKFNFYNYKVIQDNYKNFWKAQKSKGKNHPNLTPSPSPRDYYLLVGAFANSLLPMHLFCVVGSHTVYIMV